MPEHEITQNRSTGGAHASRENGGETYNTPEAELVHRLKAAIDDRGRYDFRLSDMSAGYAAAKGISPHAARHEIEDHFNPTSCF